MRTSIITAALCALSLTGFVSAVSGAAQTDVPMRPAAAAPSPGNGPVCAPAAWPYAPAACTRASADPAARPVRVIAVDAMPAGLARR